MSETQTPVPIETRLSNKRGFGPEDFQLLDEACETIQCLKASEKELLVLVREARKIIRADAYKRHMHKDWLNRAESAAQNANLGNKKAVKVLS